MTDTMRVVNILKRRYQWYSLRERVIDRLESKESHGDSIRVKVGRER
jgi:hypothetical protein